MRGYKVWGKTAERRTFGVKYWQQPDQWNREAERDGMSHRVFSSSMCDIGEDQTTIISELPKLWEAIRRTPHLDWQLLTKRAGRYRSILPRDWGEGYPNVWLGVSVESPAFAWRMDFLRKIPAIVHFVSYEPALEDLADHCDLTNIQWVIYGGESGPGFREADIQWARNMRDKCAREDVAFFHKQSSARYTERGIELDGVIVRNYPMPRRVVSKLSAKPAVSVLF